MKKLLLLLLFIIPLLSYSQEEKFSGCYIRMTDPKSENLTFENDSIKFKYRPSSYFWDVKIENKTNSTIKCNWNNVQFVIKKKSSKIIFDDTVILFKDNEKETSTIADGTMISKSIFPSDYLFDDGPIPIFLKRHIKNGDLSIRIIIPIDFGNETKTYDFKFIVSIQ